MYATVLSTYVFVLYFNEFQKLETIEAFIIQQSQLSMEKHTNQAIFRLAIEKCASIKFWEECKIIYI